MKEMEEVALMGLMGSFFLQTLLQTLSKFAQLQYHLESFNVNITIIMPCSSSSIGNTLLFISQCRSGTIPSALTATCHINTMQDLDGFSPPPSLTNIWHAHCHVRNTRKAAPPTLPPPPTPRLSANVTALPI